jgi:hypothetical protein
VPPRAQWYQEPRQDLGAHIIMSRPDWDLMLNGTPLPGGNPKRDMVATDSQKLTLGDTTVTIRSSTRAI